MGNQPAKQDKDRDKESDLIRVRIRPEIDQDLVKWLSRDVKQLCTFVPKKPHAIQPPDHEIEYMRLHGLLDLDLDDPDLTHLLK
ncbi:aspartyl/glutamyl-tRNA (Asn/Gln) amidotransferase subunit B [Rhynchospora pubera]|uniref:Aspartyl/glutamyl-tRNA (Asn/Gln) amidotransferase subunit B n=1 Tax=Rhynchospora pubera TaxID=906938 RepID=A0AAV8DBZ4_9POAL|nr:aspartyl/glutamyl-tRNA (Asn/Gln) amidotransferase subunit B [Rhynchospora pubera]